MVYTEIQDLIAVNSCQIELARHILLSDTAVALFRVSSRTGVKNKRRNSTLLASTYSIDDFNAKVYIRVLKQRQDWEAPQIKDLKLDITKHYTLYPLMAFLLCLVFSTTILERLHVTSQLCALARKKTFLDTRPPPKLLLLYCKQTNRIKNVVGGNHQAC